LPATEIVRARIDHDTKVRATAALAEMGLSVSDAIRLLMLRIADERRLPFEVKVPNAATRAAIAELEAGKGRRFPAVADMMASLSDEDD
jgi:DNA-damage-inducible protein J